MGRRALDVAAEAARPVAMEVTFAEELGREVARYRKALEKLLTAIGSPATPRALQRQLGIPYTLCWQVFQVVEGAGGLTAAKHAPTPARLKTLLTPALKAGLDRELAAQLEDLAVRFRDIIKSNAADRAAFEALIAGVTEPAGGDSGGTKISMQHRRDLVRNLSHIWGKQVDSVYVAWMIAGERDPGGDPSAKRVCTVSVRTGLRRLRPDAQLVLFGGLERDETWKPLDVPSFERWGMPVIERFCPHAIPPVERVESPGGGVVYRLAGDTLGLKGSATIVSAQWAAGVPAQAVESTRFQIIQPMGLLVLDWIVERKSFGDLSGGKLVLEVFESSRGGVLPSDTPGSQALPLDERVVALESADVAPGVPEVGAWREITSYAATEMGWNLADFDVYRVRMPFPIWGTTLRMVIK